jgi:hypothetical protein
MKLTKVFALGFAALFALAQIAKAGPPLTCHALDIGDAKSLPWGDDALRYTKSSGWALSGKANYDLSRLVADTLELLAPSTPVIVRMETIRRATLYAQRDQRIAKELLLRLRSRALDSEAKEPALSEAKGGAEALAWFDLGYLVECYKQANLIYKKLESGGWEPVVNSNPASGLDGYAWVEKALSLRGPDAEMEFAAALISLQGKQADHHEHVRKAVAGAKADPLLAKNLSSFLGGKAATISAMNDLQW